MDENTMYHKIWSKALLVAGLLVVGGLSSGCGCSKVEQTTKVAEARQKTAEAERDKAQVELIKKVLESK